MRRLIAVSSFAIVLAAAGLAGAVEADPDKDEWLDSYEDEDGNLWDVFISADGFMYDAKVADTDSGYDLDGFVVHPLPEHFWYRKNTNYYHFYTDDEEMAYLGMCGTYCRKWSVKVTNYPQNVDEIWGKARTPSDQDYCDDDYIGEWYFFPGDDWNTADDYWCNPVFGVPPTPSYFAYYVNEDSMGDYDYGEDAASRILRWSYLVGEQRYQVRLLFVIGPE